jgi:hypothetical protein
MAGIFIQYEIKRDIQLHPSLYYTNDSNSHIKKKNSTRFKLKFKQFKNNFKHITLQEDTIGI